MTRAEIVKRLMAEPANPCPAITGERMLREWGARRVDAQTLGAFALSALSRAADAWIVSERPRRARDLWRELADEVRTIEASDASIEEVTP